MKYLLVAAAGLFLSTTAIAQERKTLEGNGKIVTRDVSVSSFSELKANGVFELKLSQGSTESVKIEADENLQDLFEVKQEGGKLVISMKKMDNTSLKTKKSLKVYVSFKSLKQLQLTTVGGVSSDQLSFADIKITNRSVGDVNLKLNADKITLENSSVGNLTLTGKAQDAVIKNNGVGNLEASGFVVQTLDIQNTGVGNAEVNAVQQLKVKDSFLGKVKNKGAAPVRKMNKVVI